MYSGVNKYLTPCRFRKFGHLQRNPHSNLIPSFPPIEYETVRIFEWTKIHPEMCINLVTNYKKRLTSVLANKGYSTKYEVMFCQGIKYLFPAIKCKSIHNCYKIQNRPTITIIDH